MILDKSFNQPPHVTYKYLLDKGENLTTSEVVYLLNKDVLVGKIAKATKMTIQEVRAIGERSDRYIENHKKVVMEMANKVGRPRKDSKPSEDYQKLMAELKEKLSISEMANEEKQTENVTLEIELQERDELIARLENKINGLEEEVQNLHAAAEDTEKEVAASQEHLEQEQQLMEEANIWKHHYEVYKNENARLNETLSEVREELKKSKGENVLFRAVIKEVIC